MQHVGIPYTHQAPQLATCLVSPLLQAVPSHIAARKNNAKRGLTNIVGVKLVDADQRSRGQDANSPFQCRSQDGELAKVHVVNADGFELLRRKKMSSWQVLRCLRIKRYNGQFSTPCAGTCNAAKLALGSGVKKKAGQGDKAEILQGNNAERHNPEDKHVGREENTALTRP